MTESLPCTNTDYSKCIDYCSDGNYAFCEKKYILKKEKIKARDINANRNFLTSLFKFAVFLLYISSLIFCIYSFIIFLRS